MSNVKLIGISGKINSGKDLTGEILQYLKHKKDYPTDDAVQGTFLDYQVSEYKDVSNYETKKFADKLKEIICLLIGCTRQQLEDRDFKDQELSQEWWYHKAGFVNADGSEIEQRLISYTEELTEEISIAHTSTLMKLTPRVMLQLLGTEAGRNIIHPNIWVNALFSTYTSESNWVITDCRFPNEAEAIKQRGGKLIRLNRIYDTPLTEEQIAISQHPSETGLDNYQGFDALIENDGSILDLVEKISTLGYE